MHPHGFRVALSISPFTEDVLSAGVTFTDGVTEARTIEDMQRLLCEHGSSEVYARISTRRESGAVTGTMSLREGVERARLAASLGLAFNPEFSLFGTYGDITRQPPPDFSEYPELNVQGPWEDLGLDEMCEAIEAYGGLVARELRSTGADIIAWNIGNEVDLGVAGIAPYPLEPVDPYRPPSRIDREIGEVTARQLSSMSEDEQCTWLTKHVWPHEASLLAAFASGVRTVVTDAVFSTHLAALGGGSALPIAFWTAIFENGYVPDVIGFSLYPTTFPGVYPRFKETVKTIRREFGKPVFVAEFGYPSRSLGPVPLGRVPAEGYPISDAGQARMLEDLTRWGCENGICGIRPWAPDLVTNAWEPIALFAKSDDGLATAQHSLGAIQRGLHSA